MHLYNIDLSNVLLVSDLDGTLVTDEYIIPERNIEAIDVFTSLGGKIAVATGRSIGSAKRIIKEIGVKLPAILHNGSLIYDFENRRNVWQRYMPEIAREKCRQMLEAFPDIGAEVYTDDGLFIINKTDGVLEHISIENLEYKQANLDEVEGGFFKILFVGERDRLNELARFAKNNPAKGLFYVLSSEKYFEMLSVGSSKGDAVRELARILGIGKENIYAIGDYYNDLQMLRMAEIGACPADCPKDIRAEADLVVCGSKNGAVADFIYYIIDRYNTNLLDFQEEKRWIMQEKKSCSL